MNKRIIDLTGQKFNRWTVLELGTKSDRVRWKCLCDCGNIGEVGTSNLKAGISKSCGCLNLEVLSSRLHDLTGQTSGLLSYLRDDEKSRTGMRMIICSCACGKSEHRTYAAPFVSKITKSCGCLQFEAAKLAASFAGRNRNAELREIESKSSERICTGCGLTKSFDQYNVNKAHRLGLSIYCRDCQKSKWKKSHD